MRLQRCSDCGEVIDPDEAFDRRYDDEKRCNNCNMDALQWRERSYD